MPQRYLCKVFLKNADNKNINLHKEDGSTMDTQTHDPMFRFQNPVGPETGLEKSDISAPFPLKSCVAVSKSDVAGQPPGYFKTARVLSIVGIAAYGIIRSVEIIVLNSDYRLALGVSLFCGCTIALLLVFMGFVKDKAKLAFYVPFITFVCFTAGSVYLKEFEYFFMIWLGICGIGCVYHNFKKFLSFSITSSAIIFFLFLFNFITDNTAITLSQALTRCFFAVFTAAFFLVSAKFSWETNNRTAAVLDVFSAVMEATPNFMAVLDEHHGVICMSRRFAEFIRLTDPAAVTGRPLPDLIEDPEYRMMLTEVLAAGELFEGTKEIKREGNSCRFRILLKRLEGDVSGFFIDITDITPPEAAQNPIKRAPGRLFERKQEDQDAVYLRILKSYVLHTPELLGKLREFSLDKLAEYTDAIGALKEASYGIGAAGIGDQAEALEQAVKAADYKKIQAENNALITQVEGLLMDFREMVQNTAATGQEEPQSPGSGNSALEKNAEYRHAV
jgi:PAS domain-containing protein